MIDPVQHISTEDLTSADIERLMQLARKERSLMAHKLFSAFSSHLSKTTRKIAASLRHQIRNLFAASGTPTTGPKGVSHV